MNPSDDNNLSEMLQNLQNQEQEKKVRFLEKMVRLDFGLNIFLGFLVIALSIFLFVQSFILPKNYLKIDQENLPDTKPQIKIAADSGDDPLYINEQGIDIEKAFKAPPNNLKLTITGQLKKEVFGYLPYWAFSKIDEIDIRLLTSIAYFGIEVDSQGNIIKTDSNGEIIAPWFHFNADPKFGDFVKRAKRNKTKVYVTLKCFSRVNIEQLVTNPEARENFISNALFLVSSKSLDGVNVDFEYIGTPSKEVIDGFSIMMTDLNKQLKREYPESKLTIATFVDAASNTRIHDVSILAENSDALVIMGYDFHTPRSSRAGPVAPMEGYGQNIFGLMSSYLEKAPADKLILAVAYYGYDWPVVAAEVNSEVVVGRAIPKAIPYAEIMAANKNTQFLWDENAQTPWYSYIDEETKQPRVVHFENTRSLGLKFDYINQKKLQGMGVWALGFDGLRTDLLQLIADKFANNYGSVAATSE